MNLDFDKLRETRAANPGALAEIYKNRKRREVIQGDGRLFIIAADHPARAALGVGKDPEAMANRYQLLENLAIALQNPGVDGVLVVDYPPEEAAAFGAAMKAHGMDPIFLLAPTSTATRIEQVASIASGYVYYVSLAGVTGSGALNVEAVAERLPLIRQKTGLPVGVGFGIRDAATAARIAGIADAVVVGSRIIEEIEKSTVETACANVKTLVADIRRGVDEVKK